MPSYGRDVYILVYRCTPSITLSPGCKKNYARKNNCLYLRGLLCGAGYDILRSLFAERYTGQTPNKNRMVFLYDVTLRASTTRIE
jgi:hypothetical protein